MNPLRLLGSAALLVAATAGAANGYIMFNYTRSGGPCDAYLPPSGYTVMSIAPQAYLDTVLKAAMNNNTSSAHALMPLVPRDCFKQMMRLTCLNTYPQYDPTTAIIAPTCTSVCTSTVASCRPFYLQMSALSPSAQPTLQAFLSPDCTDVTKYSSSSPCTSTTTNENLVAQPSCPAPLIPYPFANVSDAMLPKQVCVGQCCATCPFPYNLYPTNAFVRLRSSQYTLSIISFLLAAFVLVSFVALPGKRDFPGIFILNLAIGICIFHFPAFFSAERPESIICRDAITQAVQGDNAACGTQAFFIVFGILLTAAWFYVLVLNLHLSIVWRSQVLRKYLVPIHIACWTIPLVLIIVPLANHGAGYDYGSYCLLNQTWRNAILFYPLAVFIFSAFLLTLVTSAKIVQITRTAQFEMTEIIAVHLRPFFFTLGYLFIFLFFWLLDFTQTSKLGNDAVAVFTKWLTCIVLQGNTQDQCYDMNKDMLPSFPLRVTADVLVCIVGLWTFLFFGAKKQIIDEWRERIFGASDSDDLFDSTASESTVSAQSTEMKTLPPSYSEKPGYRG